MRILIVEDEKKLAKSLAEGLAKKGFAVDCVPDGKTAITRLSVHRNEYDLAILDLMLEGCSGEEVCERVRGLGVTTPILILTAKTDTKHIVELLHKGADDYMTKPFSLDECIARVRALLRRPTELKPVRLTFSDLVLDTATYTAWREDKQLPLTLKEFMLLELLMRRPNEVINREDILDHLWGFGFLSFSNLVDVHIKNLRKKLGDDGDEIIKTIRGVGYQLVG